LSFEPSPTKESLLVRRVVTGHDDQGRAVFVSDDDVAATTVALSSTAYHELWRGDGAPVLPDKGQNGPLTTFFPAKDGYRFFILTLPPGDGHGSLENLDIEAALAELGQKLPGIADWSEAENPGMHRTDTVDMEIVLSGEITLELDDGIETVLRAGDVNVQNGTRHRWHNRGTEPAVMACFMVGGTRI
jgi:mannose-6-phosphate isomerase-like protein (cupin superfamily)